MLSADLNWNDHVTTVIRKATRLIAIMRKLRNSLTKKRANYVLQTIYQANIGVRVHHLVQFNADAVRPP